jgi:hypothetical protein
MIFGAMDAALAGTLPHYRLEFRIKGIRGTFVPGGDVKVLLKVDVPTVLPTRGVSVWVNVPVSG